MVNVLSAVGSSIKEGNGVKRIRRALLSVSNKSGLVELATFLSHNEVELLSTGGTAKMIREADIPVTDVSDFTQFPEMMDGRVKTLHPKIHGGLLAVRGNEKHEQDMAENNILPIDLVVLNLYPFEAAVVKGSDFNTCIENIDIGGPSMLRSSAKNHQSVTICTSPNQYEELMMEMKSTEGGTTLSFRRKLAARAFSLSAAYDTSISSWFNDQLQSSSAVVNRTYQHEFDLKYGCNPHQKPAAVYSLQGQSLPFTVLNGVPGYINLLDAMNAYKLVSELRQSLNLPAAASFKHVSPAGAAVEVPLSDSLIAAYEVGDIPLTPLSIAYLRARNADPLSSFGDFVAVSDVVDEATARVLKREVSDGIIAPGYEESALGILKQKKGGKFIVLEAKPVDTSASSAVSMEYREVHGVVFAQKFNEHVFNGSSLHSIGDEELIEKDASRDLTLAAITVKYTQSNSVGYAQDGQMIGIGAGQQSRVDCVKLAGRKVAVWYLRQHPKVLSLPFKSTVKRQERVNARVRYIEGDMTSTEAAQWAQLFEVVPEPLTAEEKAEFLASLSEVGLASDAFFPFRDSIDHAAKLGVKYITQPGGSTRDEEIIQACKEYQMKMHFSGVRSFHH